MSKTYSKRKEYTGRKAKLTPYDRKKDSRQFTSFKGGQSQEYEC